MAGTWQGFYSENQVCRLAGIPKRTLRLWKRKGIITPSVQVIDASGQVEEGYSYADLGIIKVVFALKTRKLNLRSAVIAFRHLYERFGPPSNENWADAHVFIVNKRVFADKPDDWGTTVASKRGQRADMRVLGDLVEEEGALLVPKEFSAYVEIDPNVMDGEPVIRDTRVPTSVLAAMFKEGVSIEELTAAYAPITVSAIRKAIEYEDYVEVRARPAQKPRASAN